MAKKVLNVFKKIGRAYLASIELYYRPLINAKASYFI